MKKHIFSNPGLKLVSIGIAFLIWLMVINGDDAETTRRISNVPIDIVNEENLVPLGMVYKPKDGNNTVNLIVRARRSVLDGLTVDNFTVRADFDNMVSLDMTTIPLEVSCTDKSVMILRVEPPSLKVDIEDAMEADFAVSVFTEGNVASGFEVGKSEILTGDTVKITGPKSHINIIDKVQAVTKVDGLSTDQQLSGEIRILDHNGTEFTESQLETLSIKTAAGEVLSDGNVSVRITLWQIKTDIKLDIQTTGEVAAGYEVAEITTVPGTLSLVGSELALAELDGVFTITEAVSIEGKSENFEVPIDIAEYLQENYAKVPLRQEADASNIITVSVKIEKIDAQKLEIPLTDVIVINAPEDMSMTLTPADRLTLEVIPPTSNQPRVITADDIQITLDLRRYQREGTHTVRLNVLLPEGYHLVSDVTVVVNLEKKVMETETMGGM